MEKILLFDIDGVLIDCSEADKLIFKEIYENTKNNTGKSIEKIKAELNSIFKWPEYEWFDWNKKLKLIGCSLKYEELIKKYASYFKVYEDVLPVLNELSKNENYKLFCISDGFSKFQKIKLKALNLSKFFEGMFTSDMCKTTKKYPEFFKEAIDRFKLRNKSIYLIDDCSYSFKAATENNIFTIFLHRKHQKQKPPYAEIKITLLYQLFDTITQTFQKAHEIVNCCVISKK